MACTNPRILTEASKERQHVAYLMLNCAQGSLPCLFVTGPGFFPVILRRRRVAFPSKISQHSLLLSQ